MNKDIEQAVAKLSPEQIAGILAGRIVVSPAVAEAVRRVHGAEAAAVAVAPAPAPAKPSAAEANAAWLAGQDAYEDARARAEAAGGDPAVLNALLSPAVPQPLYAELVLHPLTLAGYVFLEAVDSPFVAGGEPGPVDLLYLAAAVIAPELAAAAVTFDDDFRPRPDRAALAELAAHVGKVPAGHVPRIITHATRQLSIMFPKREETKESEGAGPLGATAAPGNPAAGA